MTMLRNKPEFNCFLLVKDYWLVLMLFLSLIVAPTMQTTNQKVSDYTPTRDAESPQDRPTTAGLYSTKSIG
jgi:hypothetical protein